MKKIFTYPDNSSTQYIHLDSDATANTNEKSSYFLEEVWTGAYKTNEFQATPATFTNTKKEWGKFYHYVDQKKHGSNLQRYDLWKTPIIRATVSGTFVNGIQIMNPSSDWASTDPMILKRADNAAHGLRNGAILYAFPADSNDAPNTTYSTATGLTGNDRNQYVRVLDEYQFEIYRYAYYDDDGVVDASQGTHAGFDSPITSPSVYSYDNLGDGASHTFGSSGYNVWDTYPQLLQHPDRDSTNRFHQDIHLDANTNVSMDKAWFNSASGSSWMAPTRARARNLAGSADLTEFFLYQFDDEWTGAYDKPWVNTSENTDGTGAQQQMPGISNQISALSYSPTFDYTASDDNGRLLLTINTGTIPSSYKNGHPVNLTRADSFQAKVGDRFAPRRGCGIPWFMDKKDDTSFWLTAKPYRTRTEHTYAKYVSEPNKTNRWHRDSQSGSQSANAADIRFASIVDEDFQMQDYSAVFQINVTDSVAETYTYDFLESMSNYVPTYGQGPMIDHYRVMGINFRDPLPYKVSSVELVWPGNAQYQPLVEAGSLDTTSHYVEGRAIPVVLSRGIGDYDYQHNMTLTGTSVAPTVEYSTDENGRLATVTLINGGNLSYSYNGMDVTGDASDPLGNPNDVIGNAPGSVFPEQTSGQDILYQPPAEIVAATTPVYDRHLGDKSYTSQAWDAGTTKVYAGTGSATSTQWNEGLNQYQTMDASIYWPDHIAPRSANITVNQPSSVNNSANGIKYVRNSGYVRYSLDLEYPPMKEEDFARFLGFVNGMRGQTVPFRFPLQFINRFSNGMDGILFNTPNSPDHPGASPRLYKEITPGEKRVFLEGFESDQPVAILAGQHLQLADSNRNGGLHTSLLQQNANQFGQVIANVAYPFQISSNIAKGTEVNDNPKYVTVTMNSDEFIYKTDYSGLYNFSVELVFDERKD